jgi:hypothetical protein
MPDSSFADRVTRLENELNELRARVRVLERSVGPTSEHAVDRAWVREKTTYDWQGPR